MILKVGELAASFRIGGATESEAIHLTVFYGIGQDFEGGFLNFIRNLLKITMSKLKVNLPSRTKSDLKCVNEAFLFRPENESDSMRSHCSMRYDSSKRGNPLPPIL